MGKLTLGLGVGLAAFFSVVPTVQAERLGPPDMAESYAAWSVGAGTVILELDTAALAGIGITSVSDGGAPSNGSMVMEVAGAESDLRLSFSGGAATLLTGYMQTRGRFEVASAAGPLSDPTVIGDFVVSLTPNGGRVTDQVSLFRDVFEIPPESIALTMDGAAESMTLSAPLVVAESFAQEVLKNPGFAGVIVGSVVADVAGSISSIDTPVMPSGDGSDDALPRGAIGPDVITHAIGSTLSLYGTIGGISAYAMTTVSCNIGDQNAIWIDCTSGPSCNQHPVIVQNMYRLKNSRFEQVGLAWLKHGWCAADAPSCGSPYVPHGSCDWLGLHATDTYGAGLNADQQDLGPRSEIQPWSGVFPYPYVLNWNLTGNSIYKRLQVKASDIDPAQNAGALYFAEGQYIATDEQPARRYNNCTWRRVTVGSANGGGWNLNFTGSSITQQPAINAWAQNDSGVTLVNVDVPDDGRLILGYKVSSVGIGLWQYEYALYNMNSDRAVQSFNVPVASGLVVSNVGFHDVDYHSGEPYALTDWPGVNSAGVLSWQCDKFGTNPNANALRWSTLYNYRFTCNSPPRLGNIELGLFKPGTSNSVTVRAAIPRPPLLLIEAQAR